MLTLQVELLTGRYIATAYNDRQAAEWPPHPARLFSALVATWAGADPPDDSERAALEWLERAGAPQIRASDCSTRDVVTHYVPVNDTTVLPDLSTARHRVHGYEAAVEKLRAEIRLAETSAQDTASLKKQLEKAHKKLAAEREKLQERISAAVTPGRTTEAGVLAAASLLPQARGRQPRHFPSVTPDNPLVELTWRADPPAEIQRSLESLAGRVVRLGHSSSLVRCAVVERTGGEPTWSPDEDGQELLRVPLPGQLERLEAAYAVHGETEPRVLPCRFERYRHGPPRKVVGHVSRPVLGEDWVVLRRTGGPPLHITCGVDVAEAVRGALLKHTADPPPEALSGHRVDGGPTQCPHVAVVPLPFVGHAHADGRILGIAVVLPRDLDPQVRRAVLRAIGRWEEAHRLEDEESPTVPVHLGEPGVLELERVAWGDPGLSGLRPLTWCRASRVWLSATPVALDRNPGNLRARDPGKAAAAHLEAERVIARACENIGLPKPIEVTVLPSVTMPGVAKAHQHPPFPRGNCGFRRVKVHARVEFAEAVRGPVILGAGRYYGLGLMRPSIQISAAEGPSHADS